MYKTMNKKTKINRIAIGALTLALGVGSIIGACSVANSKSAKADEEPQAISSEEIITKRKLELPSDAIIDEDDLPSTLENIYMSESYNSKMCKLSEEELIKEKKIYSGVVTGLTSILAQNELLIDDSERDTYNKLLELTHVYDGEVLECEDGAFKWSEPSQINVEDGFRSYCNELDITYTSDKTSNPALKDFELAIDQGASCAFYYTLEDGSRNLVNVVGYGTAQRNGADVDYLIIDDRYEVGKLGYVELEPSLYNTTDMYIYYDFEKK